MRKKLAKYYANQLYIQGPMLYSLEERIIIRDANDSIQTPELTWIESTHSDISSYSDMNENYNEEEFWPDDGCD